MLMQLPKTAYKAFNVDKMVWCKAIMVWCKAKTLI